MDLIPLNYTFDLKLIQYILTGFLGFIVLIQLYYFLVVYSRLCFYKVKNTSTHQPGISVIVCARNEIKNLREHLENLLNQTYPNFQVIVVNDCSWDETELYLEVLQQHYSNLKVVTIKEQERYQHGKKFALSLGIKAAQYEHLLMTDADCIPTSDNWIAEMSSAYTDGKAIVLGYGGYMKEGSFINKWIRFETAFNAMQFLSYGLGGNAYMGVGRNLSYKKELFFQNKGFASHQHLLSGDDDLFINENATKKNVAVCISSDAITLSKPKKNWGEWFKQKKRHLSTSKYYKTRHKFSLGLFHFSQSMFWIISIALLCLQVKVPVVAGIIALRFLVMLLIMHGCFKRLNEKDLTLWSPLFEIIMVIVYPIVSLASRFYRDQTWK
jgi:glycosyltransferase involved in cell wall biosynthesis